MTANSRKSGTSVGERIARSNFRQQAIENDTKKNHVKEETFVKKRKDNIFVYSAKLSL